MSFLLAHAIHGKTGFKMVSLAWQLLPISPIDLASKIMMTQKSSCLHIVYIQPKRLVIREQGWCSGESTHLPPMWPGLETGTLSYVGWVCCWFLSWSPSKRFILDTPIFLPPRSVDRHFYTSYFSLSAQEQLWETGCEVSMKKCVFPQGHPLCSAFTNPLD